MADSFKFEDLVVSVSKDLVIKHDKNKVFHSLNSKYLNSYKNAIIDASLFDVDESLADLSKDYLRNYRRLLGPRRIHLSSLFNSGFLNKNYDLSFCFDIKSILSAENAQVCDHDCLVDVLLYGDFDLKIEKIFKSKVDFEFGDEILLSKLDLNSALYVLTYSESANNLISNSNCLRGVKKFDISNLRQKAIELYFKH